MARPLLVTARYGAVAGAAALLTWGAATAEEYEPGDGLGFSAPAGTVVAFGGTVVDNPTSGDMFLLEAELLGGTEHMALTPEQADVEVLVADVTDHAPFTVGNWDTDRSRPAADYRPLAGYRLAPGHSAEVVLLWRVASHTEFGVDGVSLEIHTAVGTFHPTWTMQFRACDGTADPACGDHLF